MLSSEQSWLEWMMEEYPILAGQDSWCCISALVVYRLKRRVRSCKSITVL